MILENLAHEISLATSLQNIRRGVTMYCRCINNERIDKTFTVGNLYQYTVNDREWVTVYDPYTHMSLDYIEPHLMHIDDFIFSFQILD